ncbi:hypothetical protein EVAR_98353_1 [Eumeta japonica]|uniref:Uncharacterized protein n=1 Tax=Eumeta variegata TaxID=151549 RepID=A0A4C2AFA5_EUMVA|nr:hypothetical protein EVAR_98353_1 [Eumeta japonica]
MISASNAPLRFGQTAELDGWIRAPALVYARERVPEPHGSCVVLASNDKRIRTVGSGPRLRRRKRYCREHVYGGAHAKTISKLRGITTSS